MNFVVADTGETETYKPREIFDLSIHLIDKEGNVENANCSVEIRNQSYDLILNDGMNEIGEGWYNYTYNNSKVGKYFCRQNCTKGTDFAAMTCDFIIEGDSEMDVAIILMLGVFMIVLTLLAISSNSLWLRGFFGIIDLGVLLLGINTARLIAISGGASSGIVDMLNSAYATSMWIMLFILSIAMIYGLWNLFLYFKNVAGAVRGGSQIKRS